MFVFGFNHKDLLFRRIMASCSNSMPESLRQIYFQKNSSFC